MRLPSLGYYGMRYKQYCGRQYSSEQCISSSTIASSFQVHWALATVVASRAPYTSASCVHLCCVEHTQPSCFVWSTIIRFIHHFALSPHLHLPHFSTSTPPPPDVSAKLYSPSAYYVAKQLAVLPFAVLNSLLFAFTLYGLAGLRHNLVSVGQNGLMSVMIYLIAAQVGVGLKRRDSQARAANGGCV